MMPEQPLTEKSECRVDRVGRHLTSQAWRKGKPPANKGKRYPVQPPSPTEVLRVVETLSDDSPQDLRLAALIALLWRGGLALSEALRVRPEHLDFGRGVILVRRGSGFAEREARMDSWGFGRIAAWLVVRNRLPDGPVLCILRGPTAGQNWGAAGARSELGRLGAKGGVQRLTSRQLRHAHVVELAEGGVSLEQINRQLGTHGESHRHSRVPAALTAVTGPSVYQRLKSPEQREQRVEAAAEVIFPRFVSERYRLSVARRALDAADRVVPVVSQSEADWQKTTIQAALGQEQHVRQRLNGELAQAHVVREFGEEYDEGYGRPIRRLGERAERAEAAAGDFATALEAIDYNGPTTEGAREIAREVLAKHPGWTQEVSS